MSRILQSESDTDESNYSSSASLDVVTDTVGELNTSTDSTNQVQTKLEQYSRRLSQLGLSNEEDGAGKKINKPSIKGSKLLVHDSPADKVIIRFQPIGSISMIAPSSFKISSSQPFSTIILFLEKKLKLNNVYCYINNSFAPSPSQEIGDLWAQFNINSELIVSYCGSVAFG